MGTKVYGTSDDLIEIEGGMCAGEVSCYGTDDRERGVMLVFSDGTILEVMYGRGDSGIWGITPLIAGAQFDRIDYCDDEEADPYSDVAHFKKSLDWCYAATEWERVK